MPGGAHQRRVIRGRRAGFSQPDLIIVIILMSKLSTYPIRRPIHRYKPIIPARHLLSPHKPIPGRRPLGWQPTRFLSDRAEAKGAFALAEQLGSQQCRGRAGHDLAFTAQAFSWHGLGMPARNPEAVRQRAIAAARQRTGQPALNPVFAALNPGAFPARERPVAELYAWVRRDGRGVRHLGANVVGELTSESRARNPTTRPGRSSAGPTAPSV
jgi:hypothetical protein